MPNNGLTVAATHTPGAVKVPASVTGGGNTPPTTGQIWPRTK